MEKYLIQYAKIYQNRWINHKIIHPNPSLSIKTLIIYSKLPKPLITQKSFQTSLKFWVYKDIKQ